MFLSSNFTQGWHWHLPSLLSKQTTESTRYYYSDDKTFEKSLDVYKPIFASDKEKEKAAQQDLPITILVVGSGWVGHRAFVYAQTSWWNSSGPKTVASLGQTCVCIRHRGAFCVLPPALVLARYLAVLLAVLLAFCQNWEFAVAFTALTALFLCLLALGGRGSAKFEDMLDDVAQALKWIHSHPDLLRIGETQTPMRAQLWTCSWPSSLEEENEKEGEDHNNYVPSASPTSHSNSYDSESSEEESPLQHSSNNKQSFVFGGYSSGGHVAATLLQTPELFSKYNLPDPETFFDGILMISGVLAVRPETVSMNNGETTISTPKAPTWLIQFVMQTVWGPEAVDQIPSPLTLLQDKQYCPRLPHLLVGCRNELFGLSWLDIFFCSQAYCEAVQLSTQQPAKHIQVNSDHWNILNSRALREALREELPRLNMKHQGTTVQSQPLAKRTKSAQIQ